MNQHHHTRCEMHPELCQPPTPVPEPATWILMGAALIFLAAAGRRKRR